MQDSVSRFRRRHQGDRPGFWTHTTRISHSDTGSDRDRYHHTAPGTHRTNHCVPG